MVPSVQWYEVVWMVAVIYTVAVHSRLRRQFVAEKDYQIYMGQNGLLGYIADTGILIQTWLRRVQFAFGGIGIYSLLQTPGSTPTWRTWLFVGLIIAGELGLARVATLIAHRHEGELRLARELLDQNRPQAPGG